MKKRSRMEVVFDLLTIIKSKNNTIKPTPLLRFSNLSSQSFNSYFKELQKKEFVREETDAKGRKYITLTDKGFRFLEKYQQLIGLIDEFDL